MGNEVLEQIIKIKDAVPKKQRILCNYLALNYEKIGVMTVAGWRKNAGVWEATVMRLVQLLGLTATLHLSIGTGIAFEKYNAVPQPAAGIFPYLGDGEPGYVPYGDRGRNPSA